MKRLHPDTTWPAPYGWKPDDIWRPSTDGGEFSPLYAGDLLVGLQNAEYRIVVTSEPLSAFRLRVLPIPQQPASYDVESVTLDIAREHGPLTGSDDGASVKFRNGTATLALTYPEFRARLSDYSGETVLDLRNLLSGPRADDGHARLEFARDATTPVLGLGGRIAHPDRNGTTADMFATKGYHLRGDYGGFPIPAFVTLGRSGFILLNPHPHVYFDFGYTDGGQWSVDIPGGPIDMIVIARPTPREWTSLLYEATGRPPLPRPQWLGTWFSWAGYSSSDEYIEWIRRFVEADIPLDVWALDLHWRGGKIFEEDEGGDGFNLDWEPNAFGTHGELMSVLDQNGIDAVLHVNTRMYSGDLATEGRRQGFLRDATEHQWVVDLEDSAAQTWAWGAYAERVAEGATGWWIDNSERVEGALSSGIPARNFYSSLWNRFLTARVREETGEPVLTLTRGGWLGDQTVALPWSGDTTAGVSRVKEDLNFVLNLAMTGFPFSSVDLGGFKEQKPSGMGIIDTDENVLRRIAHGFLYMPVPRLHGGLLTAPKLPWRYAPEVSELLISFIRLRHRLAPTYYSAAIDAVEHAVPLVRPLLFDFPDDQDAIRIFDEVLVGRSLLVAPITDEGWSERDVYLPEGDWFDYWSGSHLAGGRSHRVDAPLYEPSGLPIFVRSGGMLAYRPLSSPREGFSELTVALYRQVSVPTSAQSCELPPQEFRTPDGSSLTVDVSGDELTLTTAGAQEWSVTFEFPVSDAAPRQSIGGTRVDGPLRLPPAGRTCVALDWDTGR